MKLVATVRFLLPLLFLISTVHAEVVRRCLDLDAANIRLQARVEFLQSRMEEAVKNAGEEALKKSGLVAEKAGTGSAPDLAVALATVIAGRAKEEARVWLVDQITTQICGNGSGAKPYFTNTCDAVPAEGQFPGPSLTLIKTKLRRDLYALPACYVYLDRYVGETVPAADDSAIDSYVVEALLVALYDQIKKNDQSREDAPALSGWPGDEKFASLLMLSVAGKEQLWKQLKDQKITAFLQAVSDIKKELGAKSSTLPRRIIQIVTEYEINYFSGEKWELLQKLSDLDGTFLSGAQGNYTEVALGAANEFLCKGRTDQESRLCARLPLLGEVASADSREDMEAALDRVISPIGAWKRKQSESMWSLDAMAGVAVGYETLQKSGESASHSTMGLYMPVGIEYSHQVKLGPYIRSWAVGLSVLDLGGLVSYSKEDKLQGGETSSSSNSSWSSVTSPGIYAAIAFKNSPFRAGLSASRTPHLRSIDFGNGIKQDVDSTRYLFFVSVDVTLLGF